MNIRTDPRVLGAVEAEPNYLLPTTERPRSYTFEPPPGEPWNTALPEPHAVTIRNARPILDSVDLDCEGFDLLEHQSAVKNFYDDAEVRAVYYSEAAQALTQVTGADRVFIFDHTVRRRVPGAEDRRAGSRQPATRVHVDHTVRSGPQRVRDLFPEEAEQLLRGRVQIINLWRPIRGPLRDAPLAVCDAQTVSPDDLVASDLIYRHRVGELYGVKYNPAHQWFYVPEMRTDEVLLLKCYDSALDGRARFLPHTAFIDPTTPPDAAPRESIELRTLVFHAK